MYVLYIVLSTGKSSCIAAIANRYSFHIYDLDLSQVQSNIQLTNLLIKVPDHSIVLMEDIDRQLPNDIIGKQQSSKTTSTTSSKPTQMDVYGRKIQSLTTSGLLNMLDGIWSGVSQQRIFIATSNYPEKLDPALIRSGRMDMKIQLTYATQQMFIDLIHTHFNNYQYSMPDELTESVQKLLSRNIAPCDISEQLVRRRNLDAHVAIHQIITELNEMCDERELQSRLDAEKQKKDTSAQVDDIAADSNEPATNIIAG